LEVEDYVVLLATDPSSLSSQVNKLIAQGRDDKGLRWQPQGGVAISEIHEEGTGESTQWAQAMVKRTE
jgi:hypothetical protein